MRTVPGGVEIADMPEDFDPQFTDDGLVLRWVGSINGARYAVGLRPARTAEAIAKAQDDLRFGVWQLHEFARLERPDLMQYASADRHADGRRPSKRR